MLRILPALVLLPTLALANPLRIQVIEPPQAVRSTDVATLAKLGESLSLRASGSPGETVATSFAVTPAANEGAPDGRSLRVQWTSLDGSAGIIDRARVSVRVIENWFQGGTAWSSITADRRRLYVPELLLNDDSLVFADQEKQRNYLLLRQAGKSQRVDVTIDGIARDRSGAHGLPGVLADTTELAPVHFDNDSFRQLWVNVTIPEDAKPGSYAGRMQLEYGGQQLSGGIQVEVMPIALAPSPLEYAVYYRGKLSSRSDTISSEWKSPQQMLEEFRNLRTHQIENATIYQPDDKLELLEQVLSLRRQAGLNNTKIYYLGFSVGSERTVLDLQKVRARVRRVMEVFKRHGAAEVYIYGLDEATGPKLAGQKTAWAQVRETGAKIYATGKRLDADFIAEHADIAVLAHAPDRELAKRLQATGIKVFSYDNPQSGPENPLLFRRNYGVELWRAGYDGALVYAYQHGFGSIYNDFDDLEYRDHVLAYPTSTGVIDTLAWEGMREAVIDVRYLATLENAVQSFGTAPAGPHVEQAREFLRLTKLRGSNDLNAMRRTAAGLIVALTGKGAGN